MWMRPFFSSLVAYFLMCRLKPPFREPPSSAYFRAVSIFISPLIFAVVNFSRLLDILDARNSKAYKKELFCFFRKGLNEILLNFLFVIFYINIILFLFWSLKVSSCYLYFKAYTNCIWSVASANFRPFSTFSISNWHKWTKLAPRWSKI